MSELAERLVSWAHNEEMIDTSMSEHGKDCLLASVALERQEQLERAVRICHKRLLEERARGNKYRDALVEIRDMGGRCLDEECEAPAQPVDSRPEAEAEGGEGET